MDKSDVRELATLEELAEAALEDGHEGRLPATDGRRPAGPRGVEKDTGKTGESGGAPPAPGE